MARSVRLSNRQRVQGKESTVFQFLNWIWHPKARVHGKEFGSKSTVLRLVARLLKGPEFSCCKLQLTKFYPNAVSCPAVLVSGSPLQPSARCSEKHTGNNWPIAMDGPSTLEPGSCLTLPQSTTCHLKSTLLVALDIEVESVTQPMMSNLCGFRMPPGLLTHSPNLFIRHCRWR